MTEVGWLSLATSLLTLIGLLFKYWVDAAYKEKIVADVAHVKEQNQTQQDSIIEVKENVGTMKREIDGRLTEYRRLVEAKAVVDVAAALIEGRRQGAELERLKAEEKAKDVLAIGVAADKEEEKK